MLSKCEKEKKGCRPRFGRDTRQPVNEKKKKGGGERGTPESWPTADGSKKRGRKKKKKRRKGFRGIPLSGPTNPERGGEENHALSNRT